MADTKISSSAHADRIDCQTHLFCPDHLDLMERRSEDPVVYRKGTDRYVRMGDWHRKVLPNHTDVNAKLIELWYLMAVSPHRVKRLRPARRAVIRLF